MIETEQSLPQLQGWVGPWAGLRVVVAGLGVTGFSVADTLAELGCSVVVVDAEETRRKRRDADTLRIVGVKEVRFGEAAVSSLPEIDGEPAELLVTSPGWRPDSALMKSAAVANVPVWSDVQLAHRLGPRAGARSPQWLLVTGTNGKTTTVSLLEAMLNHDGRRAVACGNIGVPILDAIRDPEGYDALAVELSSFQLHYTEPLDPLAAVVLNIAEDHLDWHGGREGYIADKAKVYENAQVACIYNAEDPVTERMVENADVVEGCRAVAFTTDSPAVSMLGLVDDLLVDRAFLQNRRHEALELASRSDFGPVAPQHLVANALAAAALARAAGVEPEAIHQAIAGYEPGDHRIQPVAKAHDVLWINDSKATNPHAAEASLKSFTDVVWIAGGLPKGVDYDQLIPNVAQRLRQVILIGQDSSQLKSSLQRHASQVPVISSIPGDNEASAQRFNEPADAQQLQALSGTDGIAAMEAAVALAHRVAEAGQTVLLSPAAASMDQFGSYAARGDAFITAVTKLMDEAN